MTHECIRRDIVVLDVQCSDCPQVVHDEVRELWTAEELGNDRYIYKVDTDIFMYEIEDADGKHPYPNILKYLQDNNLMEEDEIWIHWWW